MSESRPIEVGFRKAPQTPRPGPLLRAKTVVVQDGIATRKTDSLATEEPCEIIVEHRGSQHAIAVTMRTPGNDFELAVGFLFTEGLITGRDDVAKVSYCASGPAEQLYNQVTVELRANAAFDADAMRRNFYTTSSCGVCGKASMESVRVRTDAIDDPTTIDPSVVEQMPERLRAGQRIFADTGGLHAAGLFDECGRLLVAREDVGRHNAVDKVVGALVLDDGVPARGKILQVSGRASFEIVQKAAVAGIPIVAAVSAPSSLAVSLAEDLNMTLIGFARGATFNVYAGVARVRLEA